MWSSWSLLIFLPSHHGWSRPRRPLMLTSFDSCHSTRHWQTVECCNCDELCFRITNVHYCSDLLKLVQYCPSLTFPISFQVHVKTSPLNIILPWRSFWRGPRSPSMALGRACYSFTFCTTNFQTYLTAACPIQGCAAGIIISLLWLSHAVPVAVGLTDWCRIKYATYSHCVDCSHLFGTHLIYRVQCRLFLRCYWQMHKSKKTIPVMLIW